MALLTLQEMIHYHQWGNLRILNHMAKLHPEIYTKEVKSVFPSVAKVFEHLFEVDVLWFNRMSNGEWFKEAKISFSSVETTIVRFQELNNIYNQFFTDEEIVAKSIIYRNSQGETFRNTIEELISHIMNHGTYHRGNITAMLHQLGQKGVSTDYIYYLRDKS